MASIAGLRQSAAESPASPEAGTPNEVMIYVDLPLGPSPPRDLLRVVNGSSVSLSWRNTFEQGAPEGVVLEVSGAQGGSTTHLPLIETFQFTGVPDGGYQVEIRAVNDAGEIGFGSAVTVDVPASCADATQGPPHLPTDVVAATSGRAYYLGWAPPPAGPAVESYLVEVTGSDTFTATTTSRALSGIAQPGTYTISIAARNRCGTGPATAPTTVAIP